MALVPVDARSEEHIWDKRFISRWADRCVEMKTKYGQQVAQSFFQKMFSRPLQKEINEELDKRAKKTTK